MGKTFGNERLEAACRRALAIDAPSYRSIKSILDSGLDQAELPFEEARPAIEHDNIRGPNYYQ